MIIRFGPESITVVRNAIRRAAASRTAWNAGNRVWLADLAAELRLPLHAIADELLRLSREGLITLSRCDLPFLAPTGVAAASEIHTADGIAEFHLVRV
jgi:hypothetical protein